VEVGIFSVIVNWAVGHGYLLIFIAMFFEGPAVTAAGAFAATLGYFNIYIVLLLSILGNLLPDAICYAVGFWGRRQFVDRYSCYFGLTKEKIDRLEKLSEEHAGKALLLVKLVPFLATPGLIIDGAARMPLKKYVWWSAIITIPSSLLFLFIGYYFGAAYQTINHYINLGAYLVAFIIILFIVVSYFYKKLAKKLAEKIEEV